MHGRARVVGAYGGCPTFTLEPLLIALQSTKRNCPLVTACITNTFSLGPQVVKSWHLRHQAVTNTVQVLSVCDPFSNASVGQPNQGGHLPCHVAVTWSLWTIRQPFGRSLAGRHPTVTCGAATSLRASVPLGAVPVLSLLAVPSVMTLTLLIQLSLTSSLYKKTRGLSSKCLNTLLHLM